MHPDSLTSGITVGQQDEAEEGLANIHGKQRRIPALPQSVLTVVRSLRTVALMGIQETALMCAGRGEGKCSSTALQR